MAKKRKTTGTKSRGTGTAKRATAKKAAGTRGAKAANKARAKKAGARKAGAKRAAKAIGAKAAATNGGPHAMPPHGDELDLSFLAGDEGDDGDGDIVLFDAICETPGCATPELKRAVNSFLATEATNAHVKAFPTHLVRVVAEA